MTEPKICITEPVMDVSQGELNAIAEAIAQLVAAGLVEDSGERNNGQIRWRLTEAGRLAMLDADRLQ